MIKYFYTIIITVLSAFAVNAQQDTIQASTHIGVEKSIFNVQTGILGLWVNNEARLGDEFALRSEIGLDAGYFTSFKSDRDGVLMAGPSVNIEPRWYYNLRKRAVKGGNTANNAGNYIAISFKYLPDWFTLSNYDDRNISDQVLISSKWAIRRNIGNSNFNYEAGAGIVYRYAFLKQYGYLKNDATIDISLYFRIGYTFK